VRYDYYKGTALLKTRRWTRTWDSLPGNPAPAYGATEMYQGCAQIERGGRSSGTQVSKHRPEVLDADLHAHRTDSGGR
jgi:hypothetical protein